MAKDLNRCDFIGRLGRDPEIKYTQGGVAICNFSIAVSDSYQDKNGVKQEKTEWINLMAWSKLAEICGQYLRKGSKIYASGRLQTRKWEDKNGDAKSTTEIVIADMQMLDSKPQGQQQSNEKQRPEPEDSIPF